jgi:hypothetical protein
MKVTIIGGMDRLENHYQKEAEKRGFELKIFNLPEARMLHRVKGAEALILFTGKVSHEARNKVVAMAKSNNIPLYMCHSSGICALRDCLSCIDREHCPGLTHEGKRS